MPVARRYPMILPGTPLVVAVSILAASNGFFAHWAYGDRADILAVLVGRAVGGLASALAIGVFARRHLPRRAELPVVALLGLILSSNAVTFFLAVRHLSPGTVTTVMYTYPALVVAGSALLGWTKLSRWSVLSVGLALVGVVALIGLPADRPSTIGIVYSVACAFSAAAYLLVAQVALRHTAATGAFAVAGTTSAIILISIAAAQGGPQAPAGVVGYSSLVGLGLLGTALAHTLLYRGIQLLGSARAAMIAPFEVIVVVAASAVLLSTTVTWSSLVGAAFVLAGAVIGPMTTGTRHPERP